MRQSVVALIPARSGSKRVRNKNIRELAGHPMMAYSIAAARNSGVFTDIIVSTDDENYAEIARRYGAEVPFMRPAEIAGDKSADIEWVEHLLNALKQEGRTYDCFSLLRPTSPFRLPGTIRRAWSAFVGERGADSLRAVEKCKQHPGKMWRIEGMRMTTLLPQQGMHPPWHSSQYAALPEVYVQNASLEIADTRVVFELGSIAGDDLMPFITEGFEGFDVNNEEDWVLARHYLSTGEAILPEITSDFAD